MSSYTGIEALPKSCPACGTYHPTITEAPLGLSMDKRYWVSCPGCGFRGKMSGSKQGAIDYWNRTSINPVPIDEPDCLPVTASMQKAIDLMCVAEDAIMSYRDRWTRFACTHRDNNPEHVWQGYVREVKSLLDSLSTIQEDTTNDGQNH